MGRGFEEKRNRSFDNSYVNLFGFPIRRIPLLRTYRNYELETTLMEAKEGIGRS